MDTETVLFKKFSPQFCLLKNNMIKNIHVHDMNYSYIKRVPLPRAEELSKKGFRFGLDQNIGHWVINSVKSFTYSSFMYSLSQR
jgi:hypothetical protein